MKTRTPAKNDMCSQSRLSFLLLADGETSSGELAYEKKITGSTTKCGKTIHIYMLTREPSTALPVQIKYEEKLQNFTTFLPTLKFRKSKANDIFFCSENPYLSIYVNETFSPWGRHKSKKGKHVNLLICMVIKTMPQVLLCVAAFWLKMISKWRGIFC